MANSTLQPDKPGRQDDKLNPGQANYDRAFNGSAHNNGQTADITQQNASAEQSRLLEREGSTGLSSAAAKGNTADKEGQGSWATTIASATASRAIPVKVPFFKRKRTGVIGGIVAVVTTVAAIIGIVIPNYAIVNLKEVAVNKFIQDQLATYEPRSAIIMRKKVAPKGGPETAGCTIRVTCRFKGMSQKGIDKLKNAGFTVEDKPSGNPLNSRRITNISYKGPDGNDIKITPDEFNKAMRNNPEFLNMIQKAYKSRFAVFADKMARVIQLKLRIWRGNNLGGETTKEGLMSKLRGALQGQANPKTGKLGSTDGKATGATEAERAANQQKLGEAASGVEADATKLAENYASGVDIPSLPDADSPTVKVGASNITKAAAAGTLKGLLGPLSVAGSACSVYYMIAAVGFGAKVLAAEQLIRFYFLFSNTADAIKSGEATPEQVTLLGNMLSQKDENGRTFADSFGYQYMAYNSLGDSQQTMKYKLGGGLTGNITGIKALLDSIGGGAACGAITNPFVQIGGFVAYIAATILSGGGVSIASIAAGAATSSAIAIATQIVTPMLARLVAGTVVTGNENGKDVGNAFTAGGGAYASRSAQNRGMFPLTKNQAVAYDQQAAETMAMVKAAESYDQNPLDISNPDTPAGKAFARIAPYAVSPFSESSLRGMAKVLNPVSSFGALFAAANPAAIAASDQQYNICTDPEYAAVGKEGGGLATDPFCNVKYGFDLTKVTSAQYDPDTVIQYMLDNKLIDNNGTPQGTYATFISDCLENTKPIALNGQADYSQPDYCFTERNSVQQSNMRLFFLDTTIYEGMQEQVDGERLSAVDNVTAVSGGAAAPGGATAPGGGGATIPPGNAQQLAQQLVASPNLKGSPTYINQIKAYAGGNFSCNLDPRLLQMLVSAAQRTSFYITSLNRKCSGDIVLANDRHTRQGGGYAADIDNIGGSDSTGGLAKDAQFIRDLLPVMPPGTEIGQKQCRTGANVVNTPGMKQVNDVCNHVHLGVLPP